MAKRTRVGPGEHEAKRPGATTDGESAESEDVLPEVEPAPTPPSPVETRVARGDELVRAGDTVAAIEHYRAALQIDPVSIPAMLGLGAAYLARVQYDLAEKEFRRALRIAPNNVELHHQLGLTLFRRGVWTGAAQQFRRAIELDAGFAPAYLLLGEALNQVGDIDATIRALETAIEIQPDNAKAFWALGIALDRKGEPQRAEEMYRRSRAIGGR